MAAMAAETNWKDEVTPDWADLIKEKDKYLR